MARTLTVSTVVTRCQQRADRENDNHISATEWLALLTEQYGELYALVSAVGLRHFETSATITSTGALYYTLPATHLSTAAISRILSSTTFGRDLREIMAQEQSAASGPTGEATNYAIIGERIYLYPTPPTGQTYSHRYIAQPPDLNDGVTTTIDALSSDGEAFLIWGTAVKAKAKSDEDVSMFVAEREAARVRLTEWATLRMLNQPRRRIVDEGPDFDGVDASDWRYR